MNTPPTPRDNDDFADENMQKRLKSMFSDQEPPSFASLREVQAMQERIHDLETQLVQTRARESQASVAEPNPTDLSITRPFVQKEMSVTQPKQITAYLFRVALFMLGAATFSLPLYVYLAARMHLWQLNVLIGVSLVFGATCALSAWLARRGKAALSGSLLLGGLSLIVLAVPMLIAGLGLFLGLVFPLSILITVSPTLSGRPAIRAIAIAALVGVTAILLSSFWQLYQITIPELQVAIPLVAITNSVLMGFMVIRQFPSYPVRIKLAVVLVGVTLLSIGAVAFTINSLVSKLIRQEVGDDLSALAHYKSLEIGTTIAHDKNTLETLTLNQLLQLQADVINGSHTAKELNRLDQQWKQGADEDPLIQQVLNNQMAGELRTFQARFPQFVEIFLTDSYGANIAATNRTSDYYQADEEWWQMAWNDGKGGPYIGQPDFDESAGIYAIDMALPFYNHDSKLIGILRATVDVTPFKNILRVGEFAQTGKIELVFPDRQALNSAESTSLFQLDPESATRLNSLQTSFDQFSYEGSPSLVSRQLVSTNERKDKPTMEGLGWYVVVHQDQPEALLPVTVMTRTTLIISLLLLLLTSALAIYVGRSLTTPLTQLTAVVEQVSQGDLTVQAPIRSRDEIGTLALTFNSMTTQLHSLITSMEQRVQERTHDLELASSVGRAVSEKVGNLNVMLAEATETIRLNFDLYYTQVYLVDSSGRSLVLRAGTGETGTQLLRRGHRLIIGTNSLNGRAASERKPVCVGDTEKSPSFLPNPLLPYTRSELAVPLIANDRVVGVLDMQSQRPETFSEANIPAFQVLAGQLAIAVQNSRLFDEIQEARLAVEDQARLVTRSRWDELLNAIDSSETIGYVFSQEEVLPLVETQPPMFDNTLVAPIQIAGATVGVAQLADEASRRWTEIETEIVQETMSRVGQHIESLRLLTQSERYRAQSEQASRRLTLEGWSSYLKTRKPLENGYVYDLNAVQSLPASANGTYASQLVQPVVVRDEIIGELAVDRADESSREAAEIFTAVAQKLGDHIEALRLLEQAQERTFELEEAQGFLDSVIENLPSMLFVKGAENLQFVRWNKTAEQLVGFSEKEVLGKNDYDFFPKEEADLFTYNDRQVFVSGQMLDIPEEPLQTAQQGIRYMHTRKVPIYGPDGKARYLLGIAEDITERKQAEETLRVSEARLSEALTIAKLAHWEYDVERDRFIFNEHFYSIFHTTVEQVGSYEVSSADYARLFVHPDDADLVGNEIGKAVASTDRHYATKLEHRILFSDGGVGYISVNVHIERDENGKIIRWYGANQDITERKKAEEVIRLAQQRAQIILESITIPMVITRLSDNQLTFVNPAAIEVTGFKYEEVIHQPAPDFYYHPGDRKQFITELRATGLVANLVVQLRRRTGDPFWALLSARIFEYQGEASILTTFMDITDRIRAEEGVAKRAAELQTVAQVSTTTATTLDPDRLLQAVVDLTKEQFGLYHAHIYLLDESWNTLLLAAGAGEVGQAMVADRWSIPLDHPSSIVAGAAQHRKSIIANDVYRDKDSGFLSNRLLPDTRSEMAVPMIVGEKVLGVFDVQSDVADRFTEEDASIYTTLAAQVAIALQNARLFEQTQSALATTQESETRLSEALNIAKLAHWEYDVEKDIFTFNDHFYSIFHTTAEKVGGYQLSSSQYAQLFVYPEDMPIVGAEIGRALNSTDRHYNVNLEHRILFADGGVGYISVELHVERDENGKITRYHGANQDITERWQVEETLRVSEARLSEALSIAKLAHWEYDVERDIFTFNDHFYSIFHTTVEKVGGYELSSAQYVQLFVLPEDANVVGTEIGKALASTDRHFSAKLEHRINFANGGVGYISVEVHVERDETGKIIRWYGANQDITERKLAEEAIKAEQQRVQLILESVTVPMVITRLSDNHLTFVNAPAIAVTQFEYDEVIDQPSPDFYVNLEDRKKFIMELRAKGEVADMVVRLRRKNGEAFWALLSAKLFDYQGAASILTTFMDITDRIRAQESVAKRAAELQTVAEVSTITATTLEPDRLLQTVVDLTKEQFGLYHAHIYLVNDAWNTLLLAAGAGGVGRKLVAEEHAIPMNLEQSLVARAARERSSVIVNDVNNEPGFLPNPLLPDTLAEMAVPMIVGDKVLGVFDVQSNNPQGFSAEDASIYTTLASQVAVALQNARLYVEQAAAVTQLRALDRLKSSFLANMSHELRTPLNSILGFTDVMLEGLDGNLTEYMDNDLRLIQKNGQHLLHLINDVLDMAKIESGRMNLHPETFKVHSILEEVTSITSTLAGEKNLALFIDDTSDQDIEVYADNTRLRQVMINLVNNAIKFTEKGSIRLCARPIEGARILIAVRDTGIGIAADQLEAIFQEFTQVDTSSTRKAGGTGLGLPISRRLVAMHGGRLWAESTGVEGEGSTFYVELPLEARISEVIEKQEK